MLNNTFYEIWIDFECRDIYEAFDESTAYLTYEKAKSELDLILKEDADYGWKNNYKIYRFDRTEVFQHMAERSE